MEKTQTPNHGVDFDTSIHSSSGDKSSSAGGGSGGNADIRETTKMLQKDRWVRNIRMITILVLVIAAIAVSTVVYFSLVDSEVREFETRFSDQSNHIGHALQSELMAKLRAIDALASTITSYAASRGANWPNVWLPEFPYRASSTLNIGNGISVGLHPLVHPQDRDNWEYYASVNTGWRAAGLLFQERFPNAIEILGGGHGGHRYLEMNDTMDGNMNHTDMTDEDMNNEGGMIHGDTTAFDDVRDFSYFVFHVVDGNPIKSLDNNTMMPVWQHFPVHTGLPWVQYDINSKKGNKGAIKECLDNRVAVLGLPFELGDSSHGHDFDLIKPDYEKYEWVDIWNGKADHLLEQEWDNGGHDMGDHDMDDEEIDHVGDHHGGHNGDMNHNGHRSLQDHSGHDMGDMTDHSGHDMSDGMDDMAGHSNQAHADLSGPALNLFYPVFNNFEADRKLVAIVSMTVRIDSFFLASLPPKPNGILIVVENACGQVASFDITGSEVIYLGPGDKHEVEFEQYVVTHTLKSPGSSYAQIPLSENFCPYTFRVYPSQQMRDSFNSTRPLIFTAGVAAIFVFAVLVFIFYDVLVERRQKQLAETAHRSTAIVSALFPQIVRDRLFDDKSRLAQKGMKTFINQSKTTNLDQRHELNKNAPIADLFTNTTVMFGDISGFTAWSSSRQPTEVFVLLETLYGAFDKLARSMEVFKVETIGDCYVAVTGLPNVQEDHHIRMVKFSRACLDKMMVLTREMEVSLGPDTTNLGFRVGLHSGPVTAGVLRGEKSRFQLFGDTVNMASRMESTGTPNAVQISQSTADLIIESGKGHWLRKREEPVQAKGKGKVQTYWVKTSNDSNSERTDINSDTGESKLEKISQQDTIWGGEKEEPSGGRKSTLLKNGIRKTLIDWQVELLSKLLKQIVAFNEKKKRGKSSGSLQNLDTNKISPREEIAEKIEMPEFDSEKYKNTIDYNSIQLPAKVVHQLHDLVTTIALLYHDNHFHNYEHACHVTMSANKLLSRIVVPANQDSDELLRQAHDYTYGLTSDPLTQFAIVFSSIIHDMDHHGVTNTQLVKEENRLSAIYQQKSVAEQNSIDLAFEILTAATYSDLVSCICADENDYKRFRQMVINSVMATDIFDKELVDLRNNRWKKAFDEDDSDLSVCRFDLKATIVIEHIMQAADVAHTMQHWHVYTKWNERLFQEMYKAYDAGRGSDKNPAEGWYKGELWFFDNYVIPLAKKLDECGVFGVCSDECLNYALENRKEWDAKGEQVVKEMTQRYLEKNTKEEP